MLKFSFCCLIIIFNCIDGLTESNVEKHETRDKSDLVVVTVATDVTDGYKRLTDSAHHYHLPLEVLGMNTEWLGGDLKYPGGGYKINLVKQYLQSLFPDDLQDNHSSTIIMFIDAYDTVVLGDEHEILDKFDSMEANIVFSAEPYCWPDKDLASVYPPTESPYKYLNSGGYMGYAKDLYHLFKQQQIENTDDDQLYLTKLFLDSEKRDKYRMKLDTRAAIFQNLNGASDDVTLRQDEETPDNEVVLVNTRFDTTPLVVHGNGASKNTLNSLANYLGGAWHPITGCKGCRSVVKPTGDPDVGSEPLNTQQVDSNTAIILLSIFVTVKTPFLPEFFQKIAAIDYPKNRLHLFLYNSVDYHEGVVDEFISNYSKHYLSVKRIKRKDFIDERTARTFAIERCLWKKCGYIFTVDSIAHMDSPHVIKALINDNKAVVGPMLVRPFKAWSNFWGAINTDGFYARSFDYMDIVANRRRGVWNVPYIAHSYLINATVLPLLVQAYHDATQDPEMSFCHTLRDKSIFMYVDNLEDLGHLIDYEDFSSSTRTNPEFYEMFTNQVDWEARYIHPDFHKNLEEGAQHQQPCPDVYWFPIVTQKFCSDLIDIMESFGRWSVGSNHDERLTGGYENVPTRDIHMNQVGLERHWLHFLKLYIRPLQEAVFTGYYHDPPESIMNFVVRYKPDEQPSLRPHHDSSTYTINIALNRPKIDYEGGGCRFLRYNCSVTDTRVGWVLMHPGRLTHYHEGLPVTKGTRYIMISFVNP